MNASKKPDSQAPALDFTSCPNWGRGGSYSFDPQTQKRTRVAPDAEPVASQEKIQPKAAPTGKAAADKKE